MATTETKARGLAGWSRPGKILLTLLVSVFCVEAAMAYQQIAYNINPCKSEDAFRFITADGGCKDVKTGRVWSRNTNSAERGAGIWTFAGAQNYCGNLVEGTYSDWRLPTRDEMKTVSANGAGTYLDVFWYVAGDTKQPAEGDFYKWSSTTTTKGGKYAYVIALGSGVEDAWLIGNKTFGYSAADVVCVR